MSSEESDRWDCADDLDRRALLCEMGDQLAEAADTAGIYQYRVYHADGHLVGKGVYHHTAHDSNPFPSRSPLR